MSLVASHESGEVAADGAGGEAAARAGTAQHADPTARLVGDGADTRQV